MILTLLIVGYLSVGLIFAIWAIREYSQYSVPPEIKGSATLCLLWPPIVALAIIEVYYSDKHR